MAPKVSVIIPAYNAAGTIRASLESAAGQTYEVFEIIVVDDGSTDDTGKIACEFGNVRYIRQENMGPSAARNRGIREAKGDLVAFLDADDIWFPDKTEVQVARFMDDPRLGLCASSSYLCRVDSENKRLTRHIVTTHRQIWRKLVCYNLFATPTVMVRRSCFDRVGLFDERIRFGEDWDMWLRIGNAYGMEYIDRPLCLCMSLESGLTMGLASDNFRDWEGLIALNRRRWDGLYPKTIGYCKAMSWYCLNRAVTCRIGGQAGDAARYYLKSMLYWPSFAASCCKGLVGLLRAGKRKGGRL